MPKASEARLRANAKYNAKTYKPFTVNAKISDYEIISKHCENEKMSKTKFLICAAKYCIEHGIKFD